jgi:release factor glutamine methyltransferase
LALDGGKDGLECYRALLPQAKEKLNAGGWIVLECGDGQAPDLEQLLDKYGFANVASRKDLTKTDRVVRASVL